MMRLQREMAISKELVLLRYDKEYVFAFFKSSIRYSTLSYTLVVKVNLVKDYFDFI